MQTQAIPCLHACFSCYAVFLLFLGILACLFFCLFFCSSAFLGRLLSPSLLTLLLHFPMSSASPACPFSTTHLFPFSFLRQHDRTYPQGHGVARVALLTPAKHGTTITYLLTLLLFCGYCMPLRIFARLRRQARQLHDALFRNRRARTAWRQCANAGRHARRGTAHATTCAIAPGGLRWEWRRNILS